MGHGDFILYLNAERDFEVYCLSVTIATMHYIYLFKKQSVSVEDPIVACENFMLLKQMFAW